MQALPVHRLLTLDDAVVGWAVRQRLRLPLVGPAATCAYLFASATRACGVALSPGVEHAHSCCKGPQVRRHNLLRDWLRDKIRECGLLAEREQAVPELGIRAEGAAQLIADVRVTSRPVVATKYYDVVFATPTHCRAGGWVGDQCGAAAARAEQAKRRAYIPGPGGQPVHLVPFAVETGGRFGPAAEAELMWLAKSRTAAAGGDPCMSGDSDATARAVVLARWRQEASCVALRGNWMVVMGATGHLSTSPCPGRAGRRHVPPLHVRVSSFF